MHSRHRHTLFLVLLAVALLPREARSEWTIVNLSGIIQDEETQVAYTENDAGYSLEIYRDSIDAVRCRFTLPGNLMAFPERTCPTYQVDRGTPVNRSINNAACLSSDRWSEFILGYIDNGRIASSSLMAFMNGINIVFRFKLENGDYRSTSFSLQDSNRILRAVLGENIKIGPD